MLYLYPHQDENHRLKREKDSAAADRDEVSNELNSLKLTSIEKEEEGKKCNSMYYINIKLVVCIILLYVYTYRNN